MGGEERGKVAGLVRAGRDQELNFNSKNSAEG